MEQQGDHGLPYIWRESGSPLRRSTVLGAIIHLPVSGRLTFQCRSLNKVTIDWISASSIAFTKVSLMPRAYLKS